MVNSTKLKLFGTEYQTCQRGLHTWSFMIERKQRRQKIIWTGHKLMAMLLRQLLLCPDEEVLQETIIVEEEGDILPLEEEEVFVEEEEEDFLLLVVEAIVEEEVPLEEEVFRDLDLDLYQEDEREATQGQGHDHQHQRREEAPLLAEAEADRLAEVDLLEGLPQGDRLIVWNMWEQFVSTKRNCSGAVCIQLVPIMF